MLSGIKEKNCENGIKDVFLKNEAKLATEWERFWNMKNFLKTEAKNASRNQDLGIRKSSEFSQRKHFFL